MKTMTMTVLDGAMGTMLQAAGLKLGARPETLSITQSQVVENIHRNYINAGSHMILTNTFCANSHKLSGTGFSVGEVIRASVQAAHRACEGTDTKIALDIGPIGELLEPLGTLKFDEAYDIFSEMIAAGIKEGVDAIFFETFSDLQEIRAGILAAKDICSLPIFASMTFEASGRTFLGCRADAAAMTLSALGVTAVGMNCSLGPKEAAPILKAMRDVTDLPLILKPNAGLPDPDTGGYSLEPDAFAQSCALLAPLGAAYIGGCCGTTPEYIRALSQAVHGLSVPSEHRRLPGVCSPSRVCAFDSVCVVGERINPTGKPRLAQALRERDMQYIAAQAIEQQEAGATILDVNVGLPGIDEAAVMKEAVTAISAVCDLPLQIDSSNPAALEAGLRAAPGRCLINSVNASKESLDAVLPLANKYGAAIVGLTIGEEGIPRDADERIELAKRIIDAAQSAGIDRKEIVIDCLTLTVSAQQEQAAHTLKALAFIRHNLGVQTMLGVSNISFGLPQRDHVTAAFLTQAIYAGLTMPIINPNNRVMMDAVASCRVLSGEDVSCSGYIARFADRKKTEEHKKTVSSEMSIEEAILKGLGREAASIARRMLGDIQPLDLVEKSLIPALDRVGEAYERQQIFLPQLINAAAAAGEAFEIVRSAMKRNGDEDNQKGPVLLATVEGDIHDIGKNIVKTVLENYGLRVIDLGKDVKAERVVHAAIEYDAKVIGLSALMTTTVPNMQKTIISLRQAGVHAPVIVGGAVLTEDYAPKLGADYYAKDAKQCADIVRAILK